MNTTFTAELDRFGYGDLVSATPCCGKKVKLCNIDQRWTRHCTGGCKRVYNVTRSGGNELTWTERSK